MSSLNQYIELFKENRDTICSHSVEPMNALRDKALCALTDKVLPKKGDAPKCIAFYDDSAITLQRSVLPQELPARRREP